MKNFLSTLALSSAIITTQVLAEPSQLPPTNESMTSGNAAKILTYRVSAALTKNLLSSVSGSSPHSILQGFEGMKCNMKFLPDANIETHSVDFACKKEMEFYSSRVSVLTGDLIGYIPPYTFTQERVLKYHPNVPN